MQRAAWSHDLKSRIRVFAVEARASMARMQLSQGCVSGTSKQAASVKKRRKIQVSMVWHDALKLGRHKNGPQGNLQSSGFKLPGWKRISYFNIFAMHPLGVGLLY
eukprot:4253914-Amphidinium_carterae.1